MNFPSFVYNLPMADIPLDGVQAYLLQSDKFQVIFMEFNKDVNLEEHSHAGQWGIVLNGKIDMVINRISKTYYKGDNYYIEEGAIHYGKIYKGYADITIFEQNDRYKVKTHSLL